MASRAQSTSQPTDEPFHQRLRAGTRLCHEGVDAAFSTFDLKDAFSYRAFLSAHASVLLPAERWLDAATLVPDWEGRSAALAADLAAMETPLPLPVAISWPDDEARRWGALYVIEGSRFGGRVLGGMVGEDLPKTYLAAPFSSANWRNLLADLDRRAFEADAGWEARAIAGAVDIFTLFEQAADRWKPDA